MFWTPVCSLLPWHNLWPLKKVDRNESYKMWRLKLQLCRGVFSVIKGSVTLLFLFVYLHLVSSLYKKSDNSFMVSLKPDLFGRTFGCNSCFSLARETLPQRISCLQEKKGPHHCQTGAFRKSECIKKILVHLFEVDAKHSHRRVVHQRVWRFGIGGSGPNGFILSGLACKHTGCQWHSPQGK